MATGVAAPSHAKPGRGGRCRRICVRCSVVCSLEFARAGGTIGFLTAGPDCGHPCISSILYWHCRLHEWSWAQEWVTICTSQLPWVSLMDCMIQLDGVAVWCLGQLWNSSCVKLYGPVVQNIDIVPTPWVLLKYKVFKSLKFISKYKSF